jgi:hypothetical protein
LKRLMTPGMILAAFLLISAVVASSAAAEAFQAESYPVELQGTQTESHVMSAESLSVSCKGATLSGHLHEPTEELVELAPSFNECTAGGLAATVKAEGCTIAFNATKHVAGLACPAAQAITVTAVGGNCEVKIGTQTGLSTAEFSTAGGSPSTVAIVESLKGVKYTKVKDGFACPLSGTGEKADGTIAGKAALKGFSGGQVALFVGALGPTNLCKIAPPCGGSTFPVPTFVEAKISGTSAIDFTFEKNPITVACAASTIEGATADPPNDGLSLLWNVTVFSFGTCGATCTFATISRPSAHFLAAGGAGSGLFEIVATNAAIPSMQIICNGGKATCLFSADGGAVRGKVTGGNPAKLVFTSQPMTLIGTSDPACAGPLKFTGTYDFKAPAAGKFWLTS